MHAPRSLATSLAIALVLATAWLAPGCGSGEPEFDKAAEYTPGSLAQELAIRTKALSPAARNASKKRGAATRDKAPLPGYVPEPETKGQSKGATKAAEAEDLDAVLDDVEGKARGITSIPPAEVFKQMADAVSKDSTLDAKDRDTLVEKLNELAAPPK